MATCHTSAQHHTNLNHPTIHHSCDRTEQEKKEKKALTSLIETRAMILYEARTCTDPRPRRTTLILPWYTRRGPCGPRPVPTQRCIEDRDLFVKVRWGCAVGGRPVRHGSSPGVRVRRAGGDVGRDGRASPEVD